MYIFCKIVRSKEEFAEEGQRRRGVELCLQLIFVLSFTSSIYRIAEALSRGKLKGMMKSLKFTDSSLILEKWEAR